MFTATSLPFSRSSFGRPVSSPPAVSFRTHRTTVVSAAYAAEKESENTSYTTISIPMAAGASLYEILGLHSAASGQEIKAAYRRLARECHPDVVAVDRKDMSADQFMQIHAAYATLSDPEKRSDYDRGLLKAANRRVMYRSTSFPSSSSSFTSSPRGSTSSSGFTPRRNWETDQCW